MAGRNRYQEVDACNEAGRECLERGDREGALSQFLKALELLQSFPDERRKSGLLNNMGHVQVALSRLDDALATFQQAVQVCARLNDREGVGWQLGNVGSVHRDRGEHEEALRIYLEALSVFEEEGHRL